MNDKKINEQEIMNAAYKISKEINEICDQKSKKEDETQNER